MSMLYMAERKILENIECVQKTTVYLGNVGTLSVELYFAKNG